MDRTATHGLDATCAKPFDEHGMRNSNVMAIAPTATISNIVGVSQSIEPTYKNLFVKANLSGDFTTVNTLSRRGLEEARPVGRGDGGRSEVLRRRRSQEIERIPDGLKQLYLTAFEIEPQWLIECASRRQKWIDMGQSLNLYLAAAERQATAAKCTCWPGERA